MAKRAIGIDIGRSHLRAVQIARTPDGFQVERTFGAHTRRSTDSPATILQSLTSEHGFDRHADVVVSLPHHAIFFADAEINHATLGELSRGDISALRDYFPISADEAIVQVCSARQQAKDKHSVLVAATSTEMLRRELDLLGEDKIAPTVVETPITAAQTAVAYNHPESGEGTALILHVDELTLSLAVTQDGDILMVRNIPIRMSPAHDSESVMRQITDVLSREIEITWQKLFGKDPDSDLRLFLIAAARMTGDLATAIAAEVDGHLTIVDPYAHVAGPDEPAETYPIGVAEGLALRGLLPAQYGQVNFLAARSMRAKDSVNVKRQLALSGSLLGGIIVIWIISMVLQLTRLESQYATVKAEIRDVFSQTLPEEKNIVNPLAQLEQALDTFEQDSGALSSFRPGRMTPLQILYTLSAHPPTEGNLKLNDLFIAGDSVRVTGSCDSFAAFSEWQHVVEDLPGLHIIEDANPKKDGQTGKVHFTLSLSTEKMVP